MPSYDYHCEECGNTFTAIRRVEQRNNLVSCECGASTNKRLPTTFMMKLGGSTSPNSRAQKLAGGKVMVPEVAGATSVLGHACHSGCGCK